jgi:hypothetical protein
VNSKKGEAMTEAPNHFPKIEDLPWHEQVEIAITIHLSLIADTLMRSGHLAAGPYLDAMANVANKNPKTAHGRIANYIHLSLQQSGPERPTFEVILGGLADPHPKSE